VRSDQLQVRSARANYSPSSSVLLLLLCDTESLLWREQLRVYTPSPRQRERERGGEQLWLGVGVQGALARETETETERAGSVGLLTLFKSMSLSALRPKSAARVASRNSKMTEAVAVRLVLPHSPKTHTLSLSLPNRLYFILGEAQIQTVLGISPSLRRPVIERVHSDQPSPASFHRLVCTRSARTRMSGWIEIPSSNGNKGSRGKGAVCSGRKSNAKGGRRGGHPLEASESGRAAIRVRLVLAPLVVALHVAAPNRGSAKVSAGFQHEARVFSQGR
jgi:hypothetical protein